jgi:hypothetical protein
MLKLEDIYDVTVAKDGQEAYDMVKESMKSGTGYNLIFMDIQVRSYDSCFRGSSNMIDAKPGWSPKHSSHSPDGLLGPYRSPNCFRGREQC